MTRATRHALEKVCRILHEAGWDAPPAPDAAPLLDQQRELLERVVSRRMPVDDAGRAMGLPPDQTRELFLDAVGRLRQLVPG